VVRDIADAVIGLEARDALEPFHDFLLQYRADPAFANRPVPLVAACDVLLKRQLAQALANPSQIVLTDPEIINLIASIKGSSGGEEGLPKGALDPKVASDVVMQGAKAMRQCYERALKKNPALQYQSGVRLSLEVTVRPQGTVEGVDVNPVIDQQMTECIKSLAMRWKFPTFAGQAVTIKQGLTLTPTKT
jgi:hypothetical protein